MKDVQKSIDHEMNQENSQTRKTRKKKKSSSKKAVDPRQNVVERHLDPAVGIKVSESVRSKSKLTEPSRETVEAGEDPSIVNIDTSGSEPKDVKERATALNQNSGEITGVKPE